MLYERLFGPLCAAFMTVCILGTAHAQTGQASAQEPPSYTIIDLGALGGKDSDGMAVNDAGQVTGWATDATNIQKPFFYASGHMTDLSSLCPTHECDGGGWGTAINASGQATGWMMFLKSGAQAAIRSGYLYTPGAADPLTMLGSCGSAVG